MITHTQITYFLTVAKYRSFSEAARQLFVAQSAISRQIIALETRLDLKLFNRENRMITLTPAGEVLYRELQRYDDWLTHIVNVAKQASQGNTGTLNIGILHGIDFPDFTASLFQAFSKAHPDIQLNIKRLAFQDVEIELLMGTMDLIITLSFLIPSNSNVSRYVIDSEKDMIIVSRASDIGRIEKVIPEDLMQHTFVTISPDVSRRAYANSLNYLRRIGIMPEKVKLVNTIEDIMLSVEFGLGYGVASRSTRLFNKKHIRFINMYDETMGAPVTDIMAVWHKKCGNPSVATYIEFIKDLKTGGLFGGGSLSSELQCESKA